MYERHTVSKIEVAPMLQLVEVGQSHHRKNTANTQQAVDSEDDWTGVTSAASRRKRQNRLNVRAYRESKTHS